MQNSLPMDLSRTIASLALLLSLLLVVGYARAQPTDAPAYLPTAQQKAAKTTTDRGFMRRSPGCQIDGETLQGAYRDRKMKGPARRRGLGCPIHSGGA